MDFLQSRVRDLEVILFGFDGPPKPDLLQFEPQCDECRDNNMYCERVECPDFVRIKDGRVFNRAYVKWVEETSILGRLERIENALEIKK